MVFHKDILETHLKGQRSNRQLVRKLFSKSSIYILLSSYELEEGN